MVSTPLYNYLYSLYELYEVSYSENFIEDETIGELLLKYDKTPKIDFFIEYSKCDKNIDQEKFYFFLEKNFKEPFERLYHSLCERLDLIHEENSVEYRILTSIAVNYELLFLEIEKFKEELESNGVLVIRDSNLVASDDNLILRLSSNQLNNLFLKLKGEFIDDNTKFEYFNLIFSDADIVPNIKRVKWVLPSSKNKRIVNKKALLELFYLLKEKKYIDFKRDAVLFKFIENRFENKTGVPIKPFASNKPTKNSFSEVRLELEVIISTL